MGLKWNVITLREKGCICVTDICGKGKKILEVSFIFCKMISQQHMCREVALAEPGPCCSVYSARPELSTLNLELKTYIHIQLKLHPSCEEYTWDLTKVVTMPIRLICYKPNGKMRSRVEDL